MGTRRPCTGSRLGPRSPEAGHEVLEGRPVAAAVARAENRGRGAGPGRSVCSGCAHSQKTSGLDAVSRVPTMPWPSPRHAGRMALPRTGSRRRGSRDEGDPYLQAYALLRGAEQAIGRARETRRCRCSRNQRGSRQRWALSRCSPRRGVPWPPGAGPSVWVGVTRARRHARDRLIRADRTRASGAPARRGRPLESPNRHRAVHQSQDGKRARLEHHKQAERGEPR